MPIPGLTYVTVTGQWFTSTGDPAQGSVRFVPTTRWLHTGTSTVVLPTPISVELDADGQISVEVPATNDTGFLPEDRSLTVIEQIDGAVRQYQIALPTAPDPADLNSIAPLDPTEAGQIYILPSFGEIADGPRVDIIVTGVGTVWTVNPDLLSTFMRTVTAAVTAASARDLLGVEIGADVQAYNENLADLAAINPATGSLLIGGIGTGDWLELPVGAAPNGRVLTLAGGLPAWVAVPVELPDGDKSDILVSGGGTIWAFDPAVVTTFARTLLDDTSASAMRTTLGLGTAATANTTAFDAAGLAATAYASAAADLAAHEADTTAIHGITNTAQIISDPNSGFTFVHVLTQAEYAALQSGPGLNIHTIYFRTP